jgi:hypothetical protein
MHGGAGAVLEATAECTPAPLPVDGARVSATVSILASSAAGLRVKAWEGGSGPTRILVEEKAGVEYRRFACASGYCGSGSSREYVHISSSHVPSIDVLCCTRLSNTERAKEEVEA